MQICPKKGNKIKIKPLSDFYAYLPDPVNSLRNGFERYSVLNNGITIPVLIDDRVLHIEIIDTYSNNSPICIRGIELEVEIEELESPEIVPVVPVVPIVPVVPVVAPVVHGGFDLSGIIPTSSLDQKKFPGKGYSMK